jgi:hypothetical protein
MDFGSRGSEGHCRIRAIRCFTGHLSSDVPCSKRHLGCDWFSDLKPLLQIIRHRAARLPEDFRILGEAQQITSLDGHLCGVTLNGLHFQIA